jgi:ribonuclease HI
VTEGPGSGRRRARRKDGKTMRDGERRQLALASRHARRAAAEPVPATWATLLCDGGSRGNPGPAAAAALLLAPGGEVLDQRAEPIGRATAADAEYRAILLGIALARAHGADPIEIRSDSRLAIAAVQRGGGPALAEEVRAAAGAFTAVRWRWCPRAENEAADTLVRELLWG